MREITEEEWQSYYVGVRDAYREILETKPDLLVVPLRGGEPLYTAIKKMAAADKKAMKLPPVCFLNSGEIETDTGRIVKGVERDDFFEETAGKLGKALEKIRASEPKVVFLDEVRSGQGFGAMLSHLHRFGIQNRIAKHFEFSALVLKERGVPRGNYYGRMVEFGGIKEIPVARALTMDDPRYLHRLVRAPSGKVVAKAGKNSKRNSFFSQMLRRHRA